jgi:hypothetical protein
MKKQQIAFAFVLAYLWVMVIFFGALVFDTLIVYPNIFYDVPRSLETAMAFAVVRGPHDFFPPLGFLGWLTGIGALILAWRVKPARYWILGSLLVIVCEGLFSMAFSGLETRSCSRRARRSIPSLSCSRPPRSSSSDTGYGSHWVLRLRLPRSWDS